MHHLRRPAPECPKYTNKQIKMAGVIHRLQQIMIAENLSGDELVVCAQVVSENHQRIKSVLRGG